MSVKATVSERSQGAIDHLVYVRGFGSPNTRCLERVTSLLFSLTGGNAEVNLRAALEAAMPRPGTDGVIELFSHNGRIVSKVMALLGRVVDPKEFSVGNFKGIGHYSVARAPKPGELPLTVLQVKVVRIASLALLAGCGWLLRDLMMDRVPATEARDPI